MYNFTGSSRRPRKVNLSGNRSTTTPSSSSVTSRNKNPPSNSLQAAREERAARDAERKRLKAAGIIQRTWRGRVDLERQRREWRVTWDSNFAKGVTDERVPDAISLLLAIVGMGRKKDRRKWMEEDVIRLSAAIDIIRCWSPLASTSVDNWSKRMRYLMWFFSKLLIGAVDSSVLKDGSLRKSLSLLSLLVREIPRLVDREYYEALSKFTASKQMKGCIDELVDAVLSPLQSAHGQTLGDDVFRAFSIQYLATPNLVAFLGESATKKLLSGVDMHRVVVSFNPTLEHMIMEGRLWLLAHIIYFLRGGNTVIDSISSYQEYPIGNKECIGFLSHLLSIVAAEVSQRIEIDNFDMDVSNESDDGLFRIKPNIAAKRPLPPFIKEQIESLVQQSSIISLLSQTKSSNDDIKMLARFALTLLLIFPSRRTDMRFWLCVAQNADGVPVIRCVWNAVNRCDLFKSIQADAVHAVRNLQFPVPESVTSVPVEDQWDMILLFLEMYSFVLVTGDDHEFLQGKGRQLPLSEVTCLSTFLKNLSFAMYWWGGEIISQDKIKDAGREISFNPQDTVRRWEIPYFRRVATDVVKAIYTRDSRRHFLPKDHWYMRQYLTLDGFIAAVVQEEDYRQQQLDDELAVEDDRDLDDPEMHGAIDMITRRHIDLARRDKARQRNQRLHYLATIGPRSEILQNLPFLIPFEKRVEIFREFVAKDQNKRRDGFIDPDQWRFSISHGHMQGNERLRKQHATIRRGHEFEDAYNAFWKLGDGLKEPIQITFVDRFGAEEAGIDGGGVTKEFLTGVCRKAFSPNSDPPPDDPNSAPEEIQSDDFCYGVDMFKENPQHLLYPNPTIIPEIKIKLTSRGDPDLKTYISDILNRYEFCGRILGKCIYEGILVDLSFAPFFLLRWSQPSATTVGVNDLRDLDAEVYQHLMTLMHFEGDVESTFNLDFTISSEIVPGKVETYPLKLNGDSILVTNHNRLEYVHLVSKHRLVKESAVQTSAFLRGLTKIINPNWLKMFNQSELQTLVGGDMGTPIDVEDLRNNTMYGGVYQIGDDGKEHETIRLFWRVMRELDDEQRRKVLRFVTSVSRAPLLGFKALKPRFSIRDSGTDQTRLCSASTCVNLLKLPRYNDAKTLKTKLLYSVSSNAGFDLS